MKLKKPSRTTLSAQIVEQMEKCIKEGIWPVGSKIPSEAELMKEFDVSRNTIREAILSLVHADILQSRRGGGTYVISNNRFNAALQSELQSAELTEILETRLILETAIVEYACKRGTKEEFKILEELFLERNNNAESKTAEELSQIDKAFHLQVAAASHNSLLCSLYESFFSFLEESFTVFLSYSKDTLQLENHEQLYRGIVNRDPKLATKAVKALVSAERKTFEDANII